MQIEHGVRLFTLAAWPACLLHSDAVTCEVEMNKIDCITEFMLSSRVQHLAQTVCILTNATPNGDIAGQLQRLTWKSVMSSPGISKPKLTGLSSALPPVFGSGGCFERPEHANRLGGHQSTVLSPSHSAQATLTLHKCPSDDLKSVCISD